ncbi:MAG TPA: MBL fold metallo-hydrolase [Dehalococcoidia bacterium]|nr:MBL fold metallo-hydrolase [Dehalococcoidia bacterium]
MKIKWLGHASFLIIADSGVRIITDPYEPNDKLRYGNINESADIVTVSHEHFDHANVAAVKGNPQVVKGNAEVKGIKFKGIATFHDAAGGKERGRNTIICFEVDGVKLCHCGDLGHEPTADQLAEIGSVDVLLLPVCGLYTIDATVATKVADDLKPAVIIPMHFRSNKCDFPVATVDEFLSGKKGVSQPGVSEIEFKAGELPSATQIIVLNPAL